ncbi:MAG: dihydropteroate synthase [Betaproteobacteria bacterium]|jgi:dihydropteroate synthase|nr:MAG: dihydropteroate synthase [Betaproteobacteria bacterium]
MGVVNITPDSFSDGGFFLDPARAVAHAQRLVEEGADIIDLGGESSRPGSSPVSLEEERRRVLPVLEKVARLAVPVSVDTSKPELMCEALANGASMINDITSLRSAGAIDVIVDSDAGVCLVHMQGEPRDMQLGPAYNDVVFEVSQFLSERARFLLDRGVSKSRIVLDPGFGFGKTDQHNVQLMQALPAIGAGRFALVAGLSRKSQLGRITGRKDAKDRLGSSIAAALAAVRNGASILRVHDVAETKDALMVWQAFETSATNSGAVSS